MNYGALVAAIKSYTESDFSTTDVNLFMIVPLPTIVDFGISTWG